MSLPLIDCGVNFGSKKYYSTEKLNEILNNAAAKNVTHVLSISNSISEVKHNVVNAAHFSSMGCPVRYFYTAGVHPHNAKDFDPIEHGRYLEECLQHSECVAVGECGLDYNRMFSSRESQRAAFAFQIEIAKRFNKRLYLHCRDAFEDFMEILQEHKYYHGIVHCFTGTLEQALAFTSLGFQIGITGWLVDKRRNHDLLHALQDPRITIDMLVVETDAPFLSIDRKRKSLPEDTEQILRKVAETKNIPFEECSRRIYENSLHLLGLL